MNAVVVESMLTCPHCGFAARETLRKTIAR
jgi:hypothetical protein